MTVIKIENFGGEMPSISPRALPPDAAQENRNLYLATREFRPLKADTSAASCSAGTKTLHRFARLANGDFNTNAAAGWITSTDERSYVKGQINDERTERTYLSFDDGSARLRAVDANGADRVLGVPRPVQPTVTLNANQEFTSEEANTFLFGEVAEKVRQAFIAGVINPASNEPASRFVGTNILAGPYQSHGLVFPNSAGITAAGGGANHWALYGQITKENSDIIGLDPVLLKMFSDATHCWIPFTMLPFRITFDRAAVEAALRAIELPEDAGVSSGSQLLTEAQIDEMIDRALELFDPNLIAKSERDTLDELARNAHRELQRTSFDGSLNEMYVNLQNQAEQMTKSIEAKMQANWERLSKDVTLVSEYLQALGSTAGVGIEAVDRIIDTRFYIVTAVTDWGEESEPSPVSSLIEVDQNDSVTVGRPALSSGESYATRSVIKWRIYRSNTGSQTAAFQFVEELAVGSASYTDTKKGEELGEVCPTTTWSEPPYRMDAQFDGFPKPIVGTNPYLHGLTGMPNGIMAGFFDNTVAFCEPYVPYAWPVEYQITTEFPIVGLGAFGQTLFVGTTASPYFIYGADSASMTAQKLDSNQACVSRRSIATVQGGVLFASPDGLCVADQNGVGVVSAGLFTREDWQALTPSTMFAVEHENIYYLFYTGLGGGCLTFDLPNKKLGRVDLTATAAFVDRLTDTLYLANSTSISAVFGGATRRTGRWKSGRTILPSQTGLAWLKVYGDQTAQTPVTVRWYGDGALRHTATLSNTNPVRLPAGRWLEHEIEIESAARVTRLTLASSTQELQAV